MGMNMAQQVGGMNAQNLYQMGQQQPAARSSSSRRTRGDALAGTWKCPQCGARPHTRQVLPRMRRKEARRDGSWTCSCGAVNKGKFCSECGAKKPAGAPKYKCDKCGWEPEDPDASARSSAPSAATRSTPTMLSAEVRSHG